MGGYGSTRWDYHTKRRTVEEYSALNMTELLKKVRAAPLGTSVFVYPFDAYVPDGYVKLWRRESPVIHRIKTTETRCTLGGTRLWFVCDGCSQRAGVMYHAVTEWRCRRCLGLAYVSQRENSAERLMRRGRRVARKLGRSIFTEAIEEALGAAHPLARRRPRGMHCVTYQRLEAELEQCELDTEAELCEYVDRMASRPRRRWQKATGVPSKGLGHHRQKSN